jgi:hypothetical protein
MKLKKLFLATTLAALSSAVIADHQWADYHWATMSGDLNLQVIDNVTSDWQGSFETSISKWNQASPISQTVEAGSDSSKDRKRCSAVTGKMKVCNASYGFNGWAGLASINLDSNGHISQGVAKMNDSYMASDTEANRNHVMCQEIGHVYGLGHTSEDGSSQSTCMDYSNSNNSQWPNNHDYQLLASMYNHSDGYDTAVGAGDGGEPCRGGPKKCGKSMGLKVFQKGRAQIWVSPGENGSTWIHHVTLAEGYDDIVHDEH